MPTRHSPTSTDDRSIAVSWLGRFGDAVGTGDAHALRDLLSTDPWWRDLYALTWDIVAMHGADDIIDTLSGVLPVSRFGGIELDESWPVARNGGAIEAIFRFTTATGHGRGVIRLLEEDGRWRCWIVSTSLEGLRGLPEARVSIDDAASDANNLPLSPGARRAQQLAGHARGEYRDEDPSVLILGAGHCGLFLAARLRQQGVSALLVDRHARAGDNWRLRYHGLLLHDTKWATQFPYLPYPTTWPLFVPKDMLADWMEAYVKLLDLDLWTSTQVRNAAWDPDAARWTVLLERGGTQRTLRPNHLVFATGKDGIAAMPTVEGVDSYRGTVVHSSAHVGGESLAGKRVIVVGTGSSGHDVSQDAYESGAASVTMVQRSPAYVFSQRHGVKTLFGKYYSEHSPDVEYADLLANATPLAFGLANAPHLTRQIAELDHDLIAGLEAAGFRTTLGPGDAGQAYIASRGRGAYYIDKGNAALIINGHVRVQPGEIARFTADGVVYRDGTEELADVVVFCTGYSNMREVVRPIVGDEITDQLATVWNVDDRGEIRTALRHSGHQKLWFMATGFRLARIFSHHVALLIKAMDEELLDPAVNVELKQPPVAG
ncbi:NAD(P)/FAD-dependent oxidoreductase [Jatrophihabitans sp.]|uniref:flavin-containing monooxygenase n=1 Tax=Jatrophihabitans sp. TaxID=1932789 RepID=UPI0030C74B95|nr:hypothetical protein [Jatrophihabitans sp.]